MDEHLTMDCPCTHNCKRHGDCKACIAFHRKKGWPLVACMQILLDAHIKSHGQDSAEPSNPLLKNE